MGLSLEDRLEIQDLLVRYTWFLDSFLPEEEFHALFTEDALLVSPFSGRFTGRAGLDAFLTYRANTRSWGPARVEQLRHFVGNFLIEGDGDVGFMRAFLLDYTTGPGERQRESKLLCIGHYECDVVRVEGRWRMKSRILIVDTVSGGPDDNSHLEHDAVSAARFQKAASSV